MTRTITLAGFAVLAAAGVAYQLAGLRWRRTPTLADAVSLVLRSRFGRPVMLAGWLWLGWHLFARAEPL